MASFLRYKFGGGGGLYSEGLIFGILRYIKIHTWLEAWQNKTKEIILRLSKGNSVFFILA